MPCLNSRLCGPSVLLKFLCLLKLHSAITCRWGNGLPFGFPSSNGVLWSLPFRLRYRARNQMRGTLVGKFKEALILGIMQVHGWQMTDPESEYPLKFLPLGISLALSYFWHNWDIRRVRREFGWKFFQTIVISTLLSSGILFASYYSIPQTCSSQEIDELEASLISRWLHLHLLLRCQWWQDMECKVSCTWWKCSEPRKSPGEHSLK